MSTFDTDININMTIAKMVEVYQYEVGRVRRSYEMLADSEKKLESAFGKEYSDFSTMPEHYILNIKPIMDRLKCNAWRAIVNRLQLRHLLSSKRWKELDKKLDDPKQMPKITVENVNDLLETYQQKAVEFLKEAIVEVYDYLRPHAESFAMGYKTNQKNAYLEIGPKLILTRMTHMMYGDKFSVNTHDEQDLISMDRIFSHLDGYKAMSGKSYKSPAIDAINSSKDGLAETDFFKFKIYKNGNLHVEFKRLDLLAKFNAIAGGTNIKPVHREGAVS